MIAENVGMGTSTTFGVSRLDKNQTPVLDGWDRMDAPLDEPTASPIDWTPVQGTEGPTSPDAPAAGGCEPSDVDDAAPPTVDGTAHRMAIAPRCEDRTGTHNRVLVIAALTTLFWAPLAWILNWIG